MKGELNGRLGTTLSILTDMLIDLNALQIYYEKPSSKSISPALLGEIRNKIDAAKEIIHGALKTQKS
ncbi:MAG TPA: hypothetical protein VEW28_09165 [Candidatus Kapabacteria bacterium]|nr:hypothetical protein [Candidatus Kapabacteria bacterium]